MGIKKQANEYKFSLIFIEDLGITKGNCKTKSRYGIFRCPICNSEIRTTFQSAIRSKKCLSCSGAENAKVENPHSENKNYKRWLKMRERCLSESSESFKNYGGRGIHIAKEWENDFIAYDTYIRSLENSNKDGYTIDRIDNDKGYIKGNLRWVNRTIQALNRRNKQSKTGIRGITMTKKGIYVARVTVETKRVTVGSSKDLIKVVRLRNEYIANNNLSNQMRSVIK